MGRSPGFCDIGFRNSGIIANIGKPPEQAIVSAIVIHLAADPFAIAHVDFKHTVNVASHSFAIYVAGLGLPASSNLTP